MRLETELRLAVIGLLQSVYGITQVATGWKVVFPGQSATAGNQIVQVRHNTVYSTIDAGIIAANVQFYLADGDSEWLTTGLTLKAAGTVSWRPSGFAAVDTGLARAAAGVCSVTDGSTGGGAIRLPQRTAPTTASNAGHIYAKDVAGTAEVFVMDEAGTETQISPHRMDGPAWLYDADDPMPRVQFECNYYLGICRYTNLSRKDRLFELQLSKGTLPTGNASRIVHTETFAEHNNRLSLTGDNALSLRDWSADQARDKAEWDAARAAEATARAEWRAKSVKARGDTPEPAVRPTRDVKPAPAWIAARAGK